MTYLATTIFCIGLTYTNTSSAELIALSYGAYAGKLYRELKNEVPPSEADPAAADAFSRKIICDEITQSGFFEAMLQLEPVYLPEIKFNRDQKGYSDIFHQIFRTKSSEDSYEYTNPYEQLIHPIAKSRGLGEYESVFLCPLKRKSSGAIVPLYISKEYNVGPFGDLLHMPGRFGLLLGPYPGIHSVILAEEPAQVYTGTGVGFDLEHYYLQIRKYVEPAAEDKIDPLCKLLSRDFLSPHNQHYRLCVAISRSTSFRNKMKYPRESLSSYCIPQEISFRTPEGREEMTRQKSYNENVTSCFFTCTADCKEHSIFLYVSRAYISNHVFVYRRDLWDGKLYLENLSTNVKVLDELNSFDFVEN